MKERLRKFLAGFVGSAIPTALRPRLSDREEPRSVLPSISADLMASILEEAEEGYVERLFTLYRDIMVDSHLLGEFTKRKLAVLKEVPAILPAEENDPRAVAAADLIRGQWEGLRGRREVLSHMLDSTLYPVAVVRKRYQAAPAGSGLRYVLAALEPVPHHLLDYRDGLLKIRDVGEDGCPLSTYHVPSGREYLIHRGHLLTGVPDKWGGPMRAVLFWWLFKTMNREWWARFLERFGAPFMVGKYQDGDNLSRAELVSAFSQATRIFGLAIPSQASVELMQAAASQTGDAFLAFHEVANAELSKLIVGQTMTTMASANGMSGAQAEVHQGVRDDIAAYDAMALAETLRDDLFAQLAGINGVVGPLPTLQFGGQAQADALSTATLLTAYGQAGFEPADEAAEVLGRLAGFPVRRKTATLRPLGLPLAAAADEASAELATSASAAVARATRRRLAGLSRGGLAGLVENSVSAADLDRRLIAALSATSHSAAAIFADVLATNALNGTGSGFSR